ncbi:hypothetical protein LPJGGPFB_05176 [Ensifer adhaerens]|nr:hypothetical protein [Ensifer adhaerens]
MAQISMEIMRLTGSVPSGNQQSAISGFRSSAISVHRFSLDFPGVWNSAGKGRSTFRSCRRRSTKARSPPTSFVNRTPRRRRCRSMSLSPCVGGYRAARPSREAAPEIAVNLDASLLDWEFNPDRADIGFIYTRARNRPNLSYTLLRRERLVGVCAPAIAKVINTPEDLRHFSFLSVNGTADDAAMWAASVGASNLLQKSSPLFDRRQPTVRGWSWCCSSWSRRTWPMGHSLPCSYPMSCTLAGGTLCTRNGARARRRSASFCSGFECCTHRGGRDEGRAEHGMGQH